MTPGQKFGILQGDRCSLWCEAVQMNGAFLIAKVINGGYSILVEGNRLQIKGDDDWHPHDGLWTLPVPKAPPGEDCWKWTSYYEWPIYYITEQLKRPAWQRKLMGWGLDTRWSLQALGRAFRAAWRAFRFEMNPTGAVNPRKQADFYDDDVPF